MRRPLQIPIGFLVLMTTIGGLAVYASAPRVARPALAHIATEARPTLEGPPEPQAAADYATRRADLDTAREELAARHASGELVLDLAEEALSLHLGAMIEDWVGTPYGFFGMSDEPGDGAIACGFFVSTLLEHAGFDVRRIELGRQPSEYIVQTLVDEANIERFHGVPQTTVVQRAVTGGPGIYLVGLDTHTGFLVHDAHSVRFCHASSRKDKEVVCEPARISPSLRSNYTVMGKLGERATRAWLEGQSLKTAGVPAPFLTR